ncbi:hypothetical protein K0U00_47150, partial [Paenibacillus sepulcri]|nr:hypothetical protein [Paenibacillus sepulcri]
MNKPDQNDSAKVQQAGKTQQGKKSSRGPVNAVKASGSKKTGSPHPSRGDQRKPRQHTAREIALQTLVKVAEAGAYSNLQLNRALQDAQ